MKFCRFIALSLWILAAFSCKANIESAQSANIGAEGVADFSQKEPNEAYLETRTLRDELAEQVIAGDYRLSESELDELLVKYTFDDIDESSLPTVYKRNVETLLTYTLPSYKKDNSLQIFTLDEENTEDIVIQAFDFLIDGISGFAITSNDDRIGAIIYHTTDPDINKKAIKSEHMLLINNKMNAIKSQWSDIKVRDVQSVLERAYGVERDFLTRSFFSDIANGFKEAGKTFCTSIKWSSPIETSNEVKGVFNYISVDDFKNAFGKDNDDDYVKYFSKGVNYLVEKDKYAASTDAFAECLEKSKDSFDKADGVSNSIVKDYHPYRGLATRFHIIEDFKYSTLLFLMDVMLINQSPVISYSYIDALGNKKTINNIWKYIKTLNPNNPAPDVAKRIIQQLKYYLLNDSGNNFYEVYVQAHQKERVTSDIANYLKDRYGDEEGKWIYSNLNYPVYITDLEPRDSINTICKDTLSLIGYKFEYEVEDGDKYELLDGTKNKKYIKGIKVDKNNDKKDNDIKSRVASIIDRGGIVIGDSNINSAIYKYKHSYKKGYKKVFGGRVNHTGCYSASVYGIEGFGNSYKLNLDDFGDKKRLYGARKIYGADVGILKEKDVDSIALPLKSNGNRVLIDVIKDGKWQLCYEDEVFKPSSKVIKYTKNEGSSNPTSAAEDEMITVIKAENNTGNTILLPDPDSLTDIKTQLEQSRNKGGKQTIAQSSSGGKRVSLSKDGTVSDYNTGNSAGATATSKGTGIVLKKGALCGKPRLKI